MGRSKRDIRRGRRMVAEREPGRTIRVQRSVVLMTEAKRSPLGSLRSHGDYQQAW
jgi:hypothetical protein